MLWARQTSWDTPIFIYKEHVLKLFIMLDGCHTLGIIVGWDIFENDL